MATAIINGLDLQRRRLIIRGQVQGVGFRPHIYRLARLTSVSGFVANTTQGVIIEVQGAAADVRRFCQLVKHDTPPLARIDNVTELIIDPCIGECEFHIEESRSVVSGRTAITPDTAMCRDCRRELFDPTDRRFRHAMINCTNCGPRYSIITETPYDRTATTMAGFDMCDSCRTEYEDPGNRRFHAQPVSCPNCGPRVELVNAHGVPLPSDPIRQAAGILCGGGVVAIKGIGGFHLAARADDEVAVSRLRGAKQRDGKPFAMMCRSMDDADRLVNISSQARAVMQSESAPIILAMRRPGTPVAKVVAGRNARLGIMLPYTPIHHLLFADLNRKIPALVMTSGNVSGEPLAINNAEAITRLGDMCDAFLWHDRPIARCLDDSVLLDMGEGEFPLPIRRSRGFVPSAIPLNIPPSLSGLCMGGELKSTVALVIDSQVILSQHLGDLDNPRARSEFVRTIHDLCQLYSVRPQFIAHDMHPMYISSQFAVQLAETFDAPLLAIQHHHAHAASVMAECGVNGPILALVCDGSGLGLDGTGWGCELLRAEAHSFHRIASLQPLILAGGDSAAIDISRSALAILHQTLGDDFDRHPAAMRLVPNDADRKLLKLMMTRRFQCVTSSSAGRIFDGIASLLDICSRNSFEAQAPMELESAAVIGQLEPSQALWQIYRDDGDVERIDLRPLYRRLLELQENRVSVETLAALFHSQFAAAWEDIIMRAVASNHIGSIAISGGVFANQLFTHDLTNRLERRGVRVLRHRLVPPNDGGLALGQALIAATQWQNESMRARRSC
ncbi:MAG: carbamoyltransferase HypF [Phycisphaerae bacterium]